MRAGLQSDFEVRWSKACTSSLSMKAIYLCWLPCFIRHSVKYTSHCCLPVARQRSLVSVSSDVKLLVLPGNSSSSSTSTSESWMEPLKHHALHGRSIMSRRLIRAGSVAWPGPARMAGSALSVKANTWVQSVLI